MLLRLDPSAALPLYAQLANQLQEAIAGGELLPGASLPAAKSLSDDLSVNVHTVLRAYGVLQEDGLIVVGRGRGATVRAATSQRVPRRVLLLAGQLLEEGRRAGLDTGDVVRVLRSAT